MIAHVFDKCHVANETLSHGLLEKALKYFNEAFSSLMQRITRIASLVKDVEVCELNDEKVKEMEVCESDDESKTTYDSRNARMTIDAVFRGYEGTDEKYLGIGEEADTVRHL